MREVCRDRSPVEAGKQQEEAVMTTQARVLVTGGSIGIGAACARQFAAAGYGVVIADILDREGGLLAGEIAAAGMDAEFVHMDMTSGDGIQAGVRATEHDGFDVVVANAGIARRHPFADLTDQAWDETMDVNLKGAMQTFRAALPMMIAKGGGNLIAISSINGIAYGWDEHAHYSASKAALIGLVRSLAVEFGPANVRANVIAPGYIRTAQSLDEVNSAGLQRLEASAAAVPLGRIGDPDDVAGVATFLASDAARYISGQTIVVDGGLLVRLG
jgi:3-oxoacyl-[acyl-carrier protein] reductase